MKTNEPQSATIETLKHQKMTFRVQTLAHRGPVHRNVTTIRRPVQVLATNLHFEEMPVAGQLGTRLLSPRIPLS